jgi:hypothetical protein
MSADMETTTDATEHHPILPETWRQIFALIELCSDPKSFKRRLHGLANALSAVDAATRKLADDRAQHEARLATDRAELEAAPSKFLSGKNSLAIVEASETLWRGQPRSDLGCFGFETSCD